MLFVEKIVPGLLVPKKYLHACLQGKYTGGHGSFAPLNQFHLLIVDPCGLCIRMGDYIFFYVFIDFSCTLDGYARRSRRINRLLLYIWCNNILFGTLAHPNSGPRNTHRVKFNEQLTCSCYFLWYYEIQKTTNFTSLSSQSKVI